MKLTALRCGRISCDEGLLFSGAVSRQMVDVPVTCFLVEHPRGRLLWDTGMNPVVRTDPLGHWGGAAKRAMVPELPPGEDVVARLAALGVRPEDVDVVVNSHLHNDHCGMNTYFARSRVLVRERELAHARELMDVPSSGFIRGDFFGDGEFFEVFDYEDTFDVFGDGSVTLLSTVGHTPGHQCLQLTFPSGTRFVLSGDAVYDHEQLCACRASGISWNAEAMVRGARRLRDLEEQGARVLVGHDPGEWTDLDASAVVHEEPA
jgi:glyoxylase-like metal-dependent hydrolase (beta-lactamase superfamily II)